jgi:citrate synthase
MPGLKETLYEKIQAWRPRIKNLLEEHGDVVVDTVTISKLIGGMRDLKCLVTDISYLDPNEGIRYRDYTLPELFKKLPRPKGAEVPYVEGVIYLLLTGDLPDENNINEVLDEFKKRHIVPSYVYDVIDAFPSGSHPMTIFSTAILTMHRESFFNRKYFRGLNKLDYWEPTYEDAIGLLAKLPEIGAYIYSKVYKGG